MLNYQMSTELPFLDTPTYKWIFVGGKGGVGKTSTSCAIATILTRFRNRVLLVSTDPASNIGDAFQQHFTSEPQLVNGYKNLWAMESLGVDINDKNGPEGLESLMQLPGIDEIRALSSLFDSIEKDEFDVVVFDTAPTGHTLRFLQLPESAQSFGGMGIFNSGFMNTASQLLGQGEDIMPKTQRFQNLLKNASARLSNPDECTFVCVLTPEFLPLFETERLLQFLVDKNIDSHLMVVNQILNSQETKDCPFCSKRSKMQKKYLDDIHELYSDEFIVAEVPMLDEEVKGNDAVCHFAELLSPLFSRK